MNCFEDFTWHSPFEYARGHFTEAYRDLVECKSLKIKQIAEIGLGVFECVPLVGLIPAYIEKRVKNWTIEGRLKQRELYVKKEIATQSFAIQDLYFHIGSSPLSKTRLKQLDNSSPDRYLYSLIQNLEDFKTSFSNNSNFKDETIESLTKAIKKLEDAKPIVLLISAIVSSSSFQEKRELKEQLKLMIRAKINGLQNGEELIIPCGYMNGSLYDAVIEGSDTVNGHSVLLKIKKMNNSFSLAVFNTGEGVGNHEKDSNNSKIDSRYPVNYENISEASLIESDFLNDLTNFSFTERGQAHTSDSFYQCLENHLGKARPIDKAIDKPYHIQGDMGSCTYKCLQTWLHDELKDQLIVYHSFRSFTLNQKITKAREAIDAKRFIIYVNPIATIGYAQASSKKIHSLLLGILGFLTTSRVYHWISKSDVASILTEADQVLNKRKNHPILVESLAAKALEAGDFKEAQQIVDEISSIKIQGSVWESLVKKMLETKDFLEVEKMIKSISSKPIQADIFASLATKSLESGNIEKAESIALLIPSDELKSDILASIATKSLEIGSFEEAERIALLISSSQTKSKVFISIMMKLLELGRSAEIQRLIKSNPNLQLEFSKAIATKLLDAGHLKEAEKIVDQMTSNEVQSDFFVSIATKLLEAREFKEAERVAKKIYFLQKKTITLKCIATKLFEEKNLEEALRVALLIPFNDVRNRFLDDLIEELKENGNFKEAKRVKKLIRF